MRPELEKLVNFVASSEYRRGILEVLIPVTGNTPSEIAKKMSAHLSQVSRTLGELEDKGLVKCTPRKKEKVYVPTEKAYEVARFVDERVAERYVNEISSVFKREGIDYAKKIKLRGRIGEVCQPDFVILKDGRAMLALELYVGRMHLKRESKLLEIVQILKSAAYDFQGFRENYKVKAGIILCGATRGEAHEVLLEIINAFEERGDFDCVFFEDEKEKMVSYIKELEAPD